jgi:hypothetical protein
MKKTALIFTLSILSMVFFACKEKATDADTDVHHEHESQSPTETDSRKSIPMEEHALVSGAHITIKYHSPAVRERIIWGGLVPYGDVWVTGAHQATSFEIDKEFSIGNAWIPAGKYAIFTIPARDQWAFILNKNWEQHLSDEYDEQDDILRIYLSPQKIGSIQERLQYKVEQGLDNQGILSISWEFLKLEVPFIIRSN